MRRIATILLVALCATIPVVGGSPATAQDAGYQRVVDLTFPVAGRVTYSDTYHADRSGGARKHQGTDLMAAKLQTVHAAVGGEVCFIPGLNGEPEPSYGYMVRICGDDGLRYSYVHLNNDSPGTDDGKGGPEWAYAPGLRRGSKVQRGQFIGYIGDSGNAEETPPHLHFEIYDANLTDPRLAVSPYVQGRINPFPGLEAARRRGDVPTPPSQSTPSPAPAPTASPTPAATPTASPTPRPTTSPTPRPTASPIPIATPGPAVTPSPSPTGAPALLRLAGGDRVRTAIALAQQWGSSTRAVVVVPAGSPAEALVAAPLAALIDAPVLLTGADGLDAEVAAEVRRLGARSAYVIGRTDQLALRTETDLSAVGITAMARIAAADPPALSAAVAGELVSYPQMEGVSEVLLALGVSDVPSRTWPDALSASALAAHGKLPILLTRGDVLPQSVADALVLLHPDAVRVVGGTAAISERVARDAGAAAGGAVVSRLAGASRYATSAAVAEAAVRAGLDGDRVWVATGRNYPDALAAGPAAARQKAPLLLVDGGRVGGAPESEAWLAAQASRVGRAVVVGGTGAVSDAVAADLARRLGR